MHQNSYVGVKPGRSPCGLHKSRGGHSHRRRSHGCDRGQEAVKGSRTIFKLGNSSQDVYDLRVRIAYYEVKMAESRCLF